MKIEYNIDLKNMHKNTGDTPHWIYKGVYKSNVVRNVIEKVWSNYLSLHYSKDNTKPNIFPTYFTNFISDSYPDKVSKCIKYKLANHKSVMFYKLVPSELYDYLNKKECVNNRNGNILTKIYDEKIDVILKSKIYNQIRRRND